MKIAALQYDIAWEDREKNYETVSIYTEQAAASGADVLVLPEMFSTGFSLSTDITAEPEDGPTVSFLKRLAQSHNINIVAGVVFASGGNRARNSAIVFDRDGVELSRYAKMQLFSFSGEHDHHEPGKAPQPFLLDDVRCACFICYDVRFPSLFRSINDRCDLYFVIASWPKSRQHHWDILLPARAVENQLYVVGVNRVGEGGGLNYAGGSTIIDPNGVPLADAGTEQTLIYADITADAVRDIRRELPFLRDRRIPPLP